MRKTLSVPLMVLALSAFLVAGISRAGMDEEKVQVKLTGIPEVKTAATGEATFTLAKDGSSIHYKLHLDKIENVTMSHIHAVGEGGKRGAVITWLYPSTGGPPSLKEGMFSGTLSEGDITPEKLAGDWKGKPVKDLFEEIEYGKAGVAVHTKQNPGTELWGVHKEKKHAGKEDMGKGHGKTGY